MFLMFSFKQLLWVQLVLPIFLKFGLESGYVGTCQGTLVLGTFIAYLTQTSGTVSLRLTHSTKVVYFQMPISTVIPQRPISKALNGQQASSGWMPQML